MNAIFLGTFDPPHNGHHHVLKTVNDNASKFGIDWIHVIPTMQNPNKSKSTEFIHRFRMCFRMISDLLDHTIIDDIEDEFSHQYTYELIDYIKGGDIFIGTEFIWIITVETYKELLEGRWKESERLLNENRFIVVYDSSDQRFIDSIIDNDNVQVLEMTKCKNIHSSDIRKNIDMHKDFLNESVYNYVKENKLYNE